MKLRSKVTKSEFSKSVKLASSNAANEVRFKPTTSKYVMVGGIPHKWSNGDLVSLTKLSK